MLKIKGDVLSRPNKGGGSVRNQQRGPTESATRPRLKQNGLQIFLHGSP